MINQSEKYSLGFLANSGRTESSLQINNPGTSDAGTYTCHAENVIGSDNSSGILTVNGNITIIIATYVYINIST